jgi:hypothetical protein
MPNYIARVALHDADEEKDYEKLRANMEAHGFLRIILGRDSRVYQLPTGTYVLENTDVTLGFAYQEAKEAAGATGFEYSLIVADWNLAKFTNLVRAEIGIT